MATLQQQVQQHLDNTRISLRELSRRSGVSHTTISKIVKGGEYKSGTADSLLFAIDFYTAGRLKTLDAAVSEINSKAAETLHDKVEDIAADRVDHDKGAWDVDLNCAKYRRVMQLEKELEQSKAEASVWRDKAGQARLNARKLQDYADARSRECSYHSEKAAELRGAVEQLTADLEAEKRNFAALEQVHEQREQHLKSCENTLIEADQKLNDANTAWVSLNTQHGTTTQQLRDARAEIKRLTALSDTHGQSWKAACVQVEQLQKQLADKRENYQELYKYSIQQGKEILAKIDALFAERDNMRTEYEYSLMRLRVRCFALVCAIVFLIVSSLVLWGA